MRCQESGVDRLSHWRLRRWFLSVLLVVSQLTACGCRCVWLLSQVVVRLSLGIDVSKKVAMKLTVRASTSELSEVIHQIIQSA